MRLTTVSMIAALLVVQGATAQDFQGQRRAPRRETPRQARPDGPNDHLFYKAFYLERGARRLDQAVAAYREFLAKAKDSQYAPRAARYLVNTLNRLGKTEEARKVGEQFADLIARAPAARRGGFGGPEGRRGGFGGPEGRRGGFGGARGGFGNRGGARGGDVDVAQLKQRLERLKVNLATAKDSGNEERVKGLERAIANVERQIADAGSGGARGGEARRGDAERRGGGQGRRGGGQGRRGRFNMRPPSEMTAEQRDQWIEMMDRMVDRIADRVDEDRADALIKGFDKIKKLIKDKKLKEADKAVEEWRQLLFRRR